ncbi:hypothetical protein Anas_04855 [Armadillidium nasatum]|uniref:Transcription termination factor 3, mitochondrial n=1 Tax=Armadillidium nasatum TaxID=96803 RepID=A0A5N5T4D6_9CRUS|nr:hypothetical protein Anas_04855 [Armadillidium nasatum]
MRIMQEKNILLQLWPRILNSFKKRRSYKQLCFSDSFLRLNYSTSVKGLKFYRTQHNEHKDTFKKLKFDMNNDIVDMLGEIFETEDEKFKKALSRQKVLETCSEEYLRDNALYLRDLNITAEHVALSPWILSLTKEDIEVKIPFIKQEYLFENLLDGLGFTILNPELLNMYNAKFEKEEEEFEPFRNRIYYIGNRLNIPVEFLALKLVEGWEILHDKKHTLDSVIDLLLEFNYKPMDILSYIRIFRCRTDKARERLIKYLEVENSLPRLWTLNTDDCAFDRVYSRAKKYGKYFSDNRVKVLEEDLNLNKEECLDLIARGYLHSMRPRVLRYKISKLKELGLSVEDFK